jgi:hypothetical protein
MRAGLGGTKCDPVLGAVVSDVLHPPAIRAARNRGDARAPALAGGCEGVFGPPLGRLGTSDTVTCGDDVAVVLGGNMAPFRSLGLEGGVCDR